MATIIQHGSKASIGATALQLTTKVVPAGATKGVYVKASSVNTGIVYVWLSTVTAGGTEATNGYPLSANDWHYFEIADPALLYVIASTTGNEVYFYLNY